MSNVTGIYCSLPISLGCKYINRLRKIILPPPSTHTHTYIYQYVSAVSLFTLWCAVCSAYAILNHNLSRAYRICHYCLLVRYATKLTKKNHNLHQWKFKLPTRVIVRKSPHKVSSSCVCMTSGHVSTPWVLVLYIGGKFVTVPVDVLVPHGSRSSASTMLIAKLRVYFTFYGISVVANALYWTDVIQIDPCDFVPQSVVC